MRRIHTLLLIVLCAAIMPIIAVGQTRFPLDLALGNDFQQDKHRENDDQDEKWEQDPVVFTPRDQDLIRDYYRNRSSNLPPGLAKPESDPPPGLQKQLRRNGILPPSLQRQVAYLPVDLDGRLHPLLTFYCREIVGQDIVIIDNRTQRIMAVIHAIAGLR